MSTRAGGYVGKGIPPQDAARFTRGNGRYLADLPVANAAHVAFVRSSEAHARLTRVDVEAARRHPEAIAVLTGEDIAPFLVNRYWGGWAGTSGADYSPLAIDKVRWVGEPVAAVLAPSRYLAEDIAELVEVDYDPLPAVIDSEQSLADPSVRLYEDWESNVYFHEEFEGGEPDRVFEEAAGTIKRRFTTQRQTGVPLEPRGIVASWDPGRSALSMQASFQDVFLARAVIARVFDLPHHRVRVTAPDAGGGFGIKLPVYPEELTCCAVAMALEGRWNVKWLQDRQEDLIGSVQARDLVADIEIAHSEEGRVLAMRAKLISDGGAYGIPARGNTTEGALGAKEMPGPYDIPHYSYVLDVVMTNKPPIHPYRGVALPMTTCFMEELMEDVARVTGRDRFEVRRLNLVDEFPHQSVTGWVHEPGSYVEALDRAMERIGYADFAELKQSMREQGRYFGIGMSSGCEIVAPGATWYGERGVPISSQEGCQIRIDPSGKVHAQFGTTRQGQGIDTVLAQVIADELGVLISDVTVEMGDTETAPHGGGAWGSRQATLGSAAATVAGGRLREKMLEIAGHMLEASPEDLELADGSAQVRGAPGSAVTVEEIAKNAYYTSARLPEGMEPALEETAHFEPAPATHSNAAHATIVEVDPVTGHIAFHRYVIVQDAGRILNPLIAGGQLSGAGAQGIGGLIHEHVIYDEAGQPLATTFMDYLLPSALDVPEFEIEYIETRAPDNPLGVKGLGESGTCFSPAAIATAVSDALGVEVNRFALGPNDVYKLLAEAGIA
ncbi:MAG: aerobic carbon-monoxide dehydrogenase large subunit [Thermoleophilaceae bacterium]|nr:aerobic carbon-monoxide dehydrogenase large subunit [Thermoleophilaceae bacterium]